jgi:hypothetical protein
VKRFLQTRTRTLRAPRLAEQREKGKVTFLGRIIVKENVPPYPRRPQAPLGAPQERSTSANLPSSCSRGRYGLACFMCSYSKRPALRATRGNKNDIQNHNSHSRLRIPAPSRCPGGGHKEDDAKRRSRPASRAGAPYTFPPFVP